MKVWILNHESYGDVSVWDADTNVFQIPLVRRELEALEGRYDDEIESFRNDVTRAVIRGYGDASIEERFSIELDEVNTL